MDIVLSRRGGVSVRDQIKAQIELKILGGDFKAGQRLPSVRALARRLRVHANTVSAAYQLLEDAGHLELRPGSGVFVRSSGPKAPQDARDLDEMIRLSLHLALERYSGNEVRAAVVRWLQGTPPDRIVAIDASREMGELLARELEDALGIPASFCSVVELQERPERLTGALAVTLPYHLERVRAIAPGAAVESVNLEVSPEDRHAVVSLPAGAILLVVSHSPTVLPFASVLVRSLRGDELLVEARLRQAASEWQRLVKAADMVFADALSLAEVRRARPRRLRELRLLPPVVLRRLRDALAVVVPRR
ncbi:MAG TPA: GntR family transcriptional regulator [Vicinamibacteria bacterium]|nr:GntR family transcriptional regulator [Vicinamibacteria bacterium]